MLPLMTFEMHQRFAALRGSLAEVNGDAAHVFVPVGPPPSSPNGILFVGQATKGWMEEGLGDYETARERAAEIVQNPNRRSQFWQDVRRIASGVAAANKLAEPPWSLSTTIGWSNLVKVGHPKCNPGLGSWQVQADLCVEQLHHELAVMRPSAVVMMTRDFASSEILLRVFGEDGWTNDVPKKDRVAWKKLPAMPVVWMNHPRHPGPAGYRAAAVETAVNVIHMHASCDARGDMPS